MSEDQTITMAAAAELIRQARADEREQTEQSRLVWVQGSRRETLAGLRAKVEALDYEMLGRSEYVKKDDVLAVIDGGGDE